MAANNFHLGLLRPNLCWLVPQKSTRDRREADVLMSSVIVRPDFLRKLWMVADMDSDHRDVVVQVFPLATC